MLEAFSHTHLHENDTVLEVVLTFEERKKSRHKTETVCGQPLAWFLDRGLILSQNDVLKCEDGTLVKVVAAQEHVSNVTADDVHSLMRAAYHLGNRHVPLQVDKTFLRYQKDHVLDAMVEGLGLNISHATAPFHPENGAYSHSHKHEH